MKFSILASLLILLGFNSAHAKYKMGDEKPAKVSNELAPFPAKNGTKKTDPETQVMESLSKRYGTPIDRLKYYRKIHYGYEEIVPALIVAREAQVEEGRVLKLRLENEPWKKIADSFSVDLKPLNKEVVEVLTPIRKILPETALKERPTQRP